MAWRRGQAFGQDLRDRVLACPDLTLVQVATRFDISPSYVSKVRARLRELGDAAPGPQHNHVPLRLASLTDAVHTQVAAEPDAKLRGLRVWLDRTHGVRVSHSKKHLRAAELAETRSVCRWDRADIAEARAAWAALQPTLDPRRLVFLDETWAPRPGSRAPTRSGPAARTRPFPPWSRHTARTRAPPPGAGWSRRSPSAAGPPAAWRR